MLARCYADRNAFDNEHLLRVAQKNAGHAVRNDERSMDLADEFQTVTAMRPGGRPAQTRVDEMVSASC